MHSKHVFPLHLYKQYFFTCTPFLRHTVYALEHFAGWIRCRNQCMRAAKNKAQYRNWDTSTYLLTTNWQLYLFSYEINSLKHNLNLGSFKNQILMACRWKSINIQRFLVPLQQITDQQAVVLTVVPTFNELLCDATALTQCYNLSLQIRWFNRFSL